MRGGVASSTRVEVVETCLGARRGTARSIRNTRRRLEETKEAPRLPGAAPPPPAEAVDLVVDLTPEAFEALMRGVRDAPRPLTLVFSRGRCLAAVRRVAARKRVAAARERALAAGEWQMPKSLPTRRRGGRSEVGADEMDRPHRVDVRAKRRTYAQAPWYRIAAAASLAIRTFFDAFSRGILACLDAPMRRLRRRREQTAARGHRRVNSAPLPTHFRVDDLV